jgi:hypothetical protein
VKTTGDGILVEFASVMDALRCAVEVQRGPEDRRGIATEYRLTYIHANNRPPTNDWKRYDSISTEALPKRITKRYQKILALIKPGRLLVTKRYRTKVTKRYHSLEIALAVTPPRPEGPWL